MSVIIHRFAAPADKFFVNSFIIETDAALVVVDTQFLVSTARELASEVGALGKPLAAIIVTHPHPDHYNGLPILLDGRSGVPVYANRATIAGIGATQADKRAAWTPVYGADYPTADGMPDHPLEKDATLELAGTTIRLLDLGPGECADNSIIHLPEADALIASDLVYNACHPWLAEHRTAAWLAQLDDVKRRFADVGRVFAGHGGEGTIALLDEMGDYIREFRSLVGRHAQGGALTPDALDAVVAQTVKGREDWPLEGLVAMNAKAVAEELAAG